MPTSVTIKRPKAASQTRQFLVAALILGPLLVVLRFGHDHLDFHFDNPWLNLGSHVGLMVMPLVWAAIMSRRRLEFLHPGEESLGSSTFFEKLPMDWWSMVLLWPPPLFALGDLAHAFFTRYLPNPDVLSTPVGRALAIMGVTFGPGFFYITMVSGNSEPYTLVSSAGVRATLLRFFEWEKIHHASKHGDLYSLYHQANPALPAAVFKLRDFQAQATLERYFAEHQIRISNETEPAFTMVKWGVTTGFVLILGGAFWLRLRTSLSDLWIVLITFAIGTVLTLLLEQYRGISKMGKYKPVIEAEDPNEPEEQSNPQT